MTSFSWWASLDWDNWIYGAVAGFIGGGSGAAASGLALMIVDPNDFSIYTRKLYQVAGAVFVVNGIKDMFLYLKQNPMPKVKTVTTVQSTEKVDGAKVVTTVEQTKVETSKQ